MICLCFNCGAPLSWQGERCARCDWKTATCIVTVEDALEGFSDVELQHRACTDGLAQAVYRRRISARQKVLG